MKVSTKLIIGFSSVVILLWLLVFYSVSNMGSLNAHFLEVEEDVIPNSIKIHEIEKAADEAYQLTMDYVLRCLPEAKESSQNQINELQKLSHEYLPPAVPLTPEEMMDFLRGALKK